MAKKPLGKDKFGVQKVMRTKDYLGDSLGQFSLNAISTIIGQLTYFYTDKVGLAAGAIATVLLISKIIDAFTDLIMGNIVDHTKPGKEKYRPWLLKAGIPAGIMLVLMFTVPKTSGTLAYLTSRETATESGTVAEKVEEEEEAIPFREAITKLFHNKYWVIVLIVNLLACILYGTTAAAGTYYCKWIFGNDNLVGLLGGVGLIPTFLGFALVGVMIKKLGVVGTLKFSFGIGIISNVLMIFLHNNFTAYMVLGCFTTFATIPMMCLVGVMTTMAIDFNEYKYGGVLQQCFQFWRKGRKRSWRIADWMDACSSRI